MKNTKYYKFWKNGGMIVSLLFTFLLLMASLRSLTTSSSTTPEQLNPLVQLSKYPLVSPTCLSGKLNVKPNGNAFLLSKLCFFTNSARHLAM